jgi:peroxiredoxin
VFLGTECPVSNGYAPELERLHQRYKGRDVVFCGIHCEPDVSLEKAKRHAQEYGLTFRLALDHEQRVAKAAGVRIMPTAVVLGKDGQLLYRGRIDNRYSEKGQRRPEATTHDLDVAIAAVLAGKRPAVPVTEPFGCPLPKISR